MLTRKQSFPRRNHSSSARVGDNTRARNHKPGQIAQDDMWGPPQSVLALASFNPHSRRNFQMHSKQTKPSIVFAHGLWA